MSILLFLISFSHLLIQSSSFPISNSTKLCSHAQTLPLLQLKRSFSVDTYTSFNCSDFGGTPSYPKTESWKEGSDCCSWDGVTCDWLTGHVIELDLSCSWLYGTVHPNSTLFLFPHLRKLNLAFNHLSGSSVSDGFGRFSRLTHLNLSYSRFSGLISPEISHLSNLVSLDLSWNNGAEFAPHDFNFLVQNLTKLQMLHVGGISISSVFPNSLLNRSSLISLDLANCALQGRFPDHGIHLPKLEVLSLRDNPNLGGNFPRFSENNSLMELDLSSTNFSRELPASMGNLKSLQTFHLSFCKFSGSIPTSLENLTQITFLSLNDNHFSGKIPNAFDNLRNLISLDFSNNYFSGQLPKSIGNLTNLNVLYLSDNQLEGVIPSPVNGFSSLFDLNLRYNLFNGRIPSWLYTLPSLVRLDLSGNKFIGRIGEFQFDSLDYIDLSMNELDESIPSSIFELVNLTSLYLSSNNLSGVLDTSKFGKLINLTYLDLSNNMLSLTMSNDSNSMLPNIRSLDFSNNNISGIWTWNLGKYTLYYLNISHNSIIGFEMFPWIRMQILDLHSNLLQGPLPTPPNSIYFFSVSHNKLSGEISPLMCKASSMEILDLSYNNLTGMLPHCLGIFSDILSVLNLQRNQFHGTIPQTFLKGNCIRSLDLNDNQLEGPLPRSLIICKDLEVLDLGNNKINDTFPHWLGTLPKLQVLVLRSNRFHGHIGFSKFKSPFNSLRIIDLAHNYFKGNLPEMYLKNLKGMVNIDEGKDVTTMGENHYQDSITVTMKGLNIEYVKILNTFTTIDFSCNEFQGEIPNCIGNLNSLRALNLSHNDLTGHIPLSFRNLKMLESLDLSSNKLRGRIPQELTSLTFLEVLNLSQNHFSGLIPQGNQFETFGNDSYYENWGLCGRPLSKRCTTDETILEPSQEIEVESESGFDLEITLMGYGCGLVIGLSLGCIIFLSGKPKWFVRIVEKNMPTNSRRSKRSNRRQRARRN